MENKPYTVMFCGQYSGQLMRQCEMLKNQILEAIMILKLDKVEFVIRPCEEIQQLKDRVKELELKYEPDNCDPSWIFDEYVDIEDAVDNGEIE